MHPSVRPNIVPTSMSYHMIIPSKMSNCHWLEVGHVTGNRNTSYNALFQGNYDNKLIK